MKEFGFIILHYGDISVTHNCVNSILELNQSDKCHILIVDNDTDKSKDERKKLIDLFNDNRVEIIRIKKQSGFSRANNIGYKYYTDRYKSDYIVVSNNDVIFKDNDVLNKIVDSFKSCGWDILSPDVVSKYTGYHQSPIAYRNRSGRELLFTIAMNEICLILLPIIYRLLDKMILHTPQRDYICIKRKNIVPCGACIILSHRFIVNEQKVFYPETNFYYEEYILFERCQRSGYTIMYDPSIVVDHEEGKSTKDRKTDEKSRLLFLMKNTADSAKTYKRYLKKM